MPGLQIAETLGEVFPVDALRSSRFDCLISLITAIATAQAKGLPPKVVPMHARREGACGPLRCRASLQWECLQLAVWQEWSHPG